MVLTARRQEERFAGVVGVRWESNCQPGSDGERKLQSVRRRLPGAKDEIGHEEPVPQLQFRYEAQVGGRSLTFVDLWHPKESEEIAVALLTAAGFELS